MLIKLQRYQSCERRILQGQSLSSNTENTGLDTGMSKQDIYHQKKDNTLLMN